MGEQQFFFRQAHTGVPAPVPRGDLNPIWPSVYLLFCLTMIAVLRAGAYTRVVRIVQSVFSRQVLIKLEREETNPFRYYTVILSLLYILNAAFVFYKLNDELRLVLVDRSGLVQYLFFTLCVLLAMPVKAAVNMLLSVISDQSRLFSEYMLSVSFINHTLGLFLFPLNILIQFTDFNTLALIAGALVLMAVALVMKWYRGVLTGLVEHRVGILQIISYFCALEILPVLVLVKFIVETF
jgi:hypothetical protein